MIVRFPRMQHQVGGFDCGLFAFACAYQLASACNPALTITAWNQADMREHLKACFEDDETTPFPLAARPRLKTDLQECQKLESTAPARSHGMQKTGNSGGVQPLQGLVLSDMQAHS